MLSSHAPEHEPSREQLDIAVRYTFGEMPVFADSLAIFGVDSSVMIYHQRIALAEPLLAGTAGALSLSPDQGFIVATPSGDGEDR